MQNLLAHKGVTMVTDRQSMIHVSGHPGRPDLEAIYRWLRPQILVPVHGEIRHMNEQARLGSARGIPTAIAQKNGDVIRLAPGKPGKLGEVRTGRLVLDGDIIVPADGDAIVMRRRLARDGLVVVALDGKGGAQVHGIGLPLDEDYDAFVAEAQDDIAEALRKLKGARDPEAVTEAARLVVRLYPERQQQERAHDPEQRVDRDDRGPLHRGRITLVCGFLPDQRCAARRAASRAASVTASGSRTPLSLRSAAATSSCASATNAS